MTLKTAQTRMNTGFTGIFLMELVDGFEPPTC